MATSLLSAQYEFNGVVSTDKSVLKNLQDMCTACGSWLTYDIHEGKWAVVINTTGDSVASFDDSNIIGAITVQGTGLDQLTDHCIVNFPHTDINDNRDFIRIDIAEADRFPNEISRPVTIETDLFNDPVQAQLLGLIELKQRRIDRVVRFTTDFSMIGLKAGDLIDVTNSVYSYTAKMFRIISINEADADNGSINLDITALEYDADVYDTADLNRYTITNETGIVSLGNISAPGTPSVTKYEFDARPRLVIDSTAPTYGRVNGLEYWYSTDVPPGVALDENRTYKLLATTYANANAVFTSGATITTEQDSLGNISLLVKTRGINEQTAGPFSQPSGAITFAPVQVTDSISDTTQVSNTGTGSLLSALALTTLLRNLDGLFNSNTSISQAGGGLFDKMFKTFQSNTGVNLQAGAVSSVVVNDRVTTEYGIYSDTSGSGVATIRFTANSQYALTSTVASVNEGASVTFNLDTRYVEVGTTYSYSITGISSGDLSSGSLTGNITIGGTWQNGSGSVTLTLANDALTEGPETILFSIPSISLSKSVTVNDTSLTVSYSLARSSSTVNEGNSVTITLTTTGIANGTSVPYTITGTGITASDFGLASLTGNFTVNSNTASVTLTPRIDLTTEGPETFTLTLDGPANSISVTITETSQYSLSGPTTVNEGSSATITLTTVNVPNGNVVQYTITGSGITTSDLGISSLTDSFTVSSNTASVTFNIAADVTVEGNETFTLTLDGLGASKSILIYDTSPAAATYSLSSNVASLTEGASVRFTLNTTNVSNGTSVPYTISGYGTASDIVGSLTGNFTISSNTASVVVTTFDDALYEGNETLTLELDNGRALSAVTIVDNELAPYINVPYFWEFDYDNGTIDGITSYGTVRLRQASGAGAGIISVPTSVSVSIGANVTTTIDASKFVYVTDNSDSGVIVNMLTSFDTVSNTAKYPSGSTSQCAGRIISL